MKTRLENVNKFFSELFFEFVSFFTVIFQVFNFNLVKYATPDKGFRYNAFRNVNNFLLLLGYTFQHSSLFI